VLRLLLTSGRWRAWLLSSAIFGLGHAANLLSGTWTLAATLLQIGIAFAWVLFTAASYVTTLSLWAALVLHALFDGLGLGRLHPSSTRADAAVLGVLLAGAGVLGSRVARTTLPTTVTSEPATPSARSEGKRPASSAGTRPVGLLDSGVPRRDVLQPCRHWIRPAGAQAAAHQALEGTDRPRRMCHSDDGNSLVRIEPARQ
jgi:hypothetical protein